MKKITFLIGPIILIILSISVVINIKNQFLTLNMAKNENFSLNKKIREFEESNSVLTRRIEYSSSSAFIDQKMRENFGLGEENDVWLDLSPERKIELNVDNKEVIEVPKYKQWLGLFTQ